MNKRERYYLIIIVALVAVVWLIRSCDNKDVAYWKNKSMKNEVLFMEAAGQYTKVVTLMDRQNDLKKLARAELGDAYDVIRDNKEKIISLQSIVATLRGKKDTTFITVDSLDSSKFSFSVFYPNEEEQFINYKGAINTRNKDLFGEWAFSKLKLSLTLTEEKDGTWRTRVIGPESFILDSLNVVSLPKEKINPPKLFAPLLGMGGYKHYGDSGGFSLGLSGGFNIKNKLIILGVARTDLSVGVSVLKQF